MSKVNEFVKEHGSMTAAAKVMTKAGHHCSQSRLSMVVNGRRPPSIELALQIEQVSGGKYRAEEICQETLNYWAKHYGMTRP